MINVSVLDLTRQEILLERHQNRLVQRLYISKGDPHPAIHAGDLIITELREIGIRSSQKLGDGSLNTLNSQFKRYSGFPES